MHTLGACSCSLQASFICDLLTNISSTQGSLTHILFKLKKGGNMSPHDLGHMSHCIEYLRHVRLQSPCPFGPNTDLLNNLRPSCAMETQHWRSQQTYLVQWPQDLARSIFVATGRFCLSSSGVLLWGFKTRRQGRLRLRTWMQGMETLKAVYGTTASQICGR
jgi:hypothetical protein